MNGRDRLWQLVLLGALLGATWLLLSPLPQAPGGAAAFPSDKLVHVLLFAALALLAVRAYPTSPRWGIFAALVFYGAAIEIAQGRVGRTPDLLDLVADAVGALAAWLPARRAPPG